MYKVNTSNVMNDFNEIGYNTSRHSNKYLNIGNESGYNTSRHSNKQYNIGGNMSRIKGMESQSKNKFDFRFRTEGDE